MPDHEPSLTDRFPTLQPGRKPGSLGAVNGFGTTLLGSRDADPETGTYVTTHWATALFVPVFALGAYRVARADGGGWFVLGKVPLSGLARAWNMVLPLLVLAAIGGGLYYRHTTTPEYAARRTLDEAEAAAAAGDGPKAARLCRQVIDGGTPAAADAGRMLAGLVDNPPGAPADAAAVFAVAVDLHRDDKAPVPDLFGKGKAAADRLAGDHPEAALAVLEAVAPLAPDPAAELAARVALLERLHAKAPADPDLASRLATAYEEKGDRDKAEKVLAPLADKLGTRDGAATLGRIHAARGEYDKAHALLAPFVAARLPALRAAEADYTAKERAAQTRVVNEVNANKAEGFDYAAAKRAGPDERDRMGLEYVLRRLGSDPELRAARQALIAQRGVVPAVLELGMVQLQRAQAEPDPAARKAGLEAAEKTFLSVGGFVGESDEYKLSLGQVYYWLGRPAEGKKLFDAVADGRGGTAGALMVAGALREVGETTEARRRAEEAYNREADPNKKKAAARFRSLLRQDTDDEILWLSRSGDDPETKASLAAARGHKAHRDGKDGDAAGHYREAIDLYAGLPGGAGTFNNAALAHFALYQVTLDPDDLARGLDKLDRAIALKPSDSILLYNGASTVLEGAWRDAAGAEVDFKLLKSPPSADVVAYLYRTPAERAAVAARLAKNPSMVKARAYADKLVVVAPKRDDSYDLLARLCEQTRDLAGLKAVVARTAGAEIDSGDDAKRYAELLSGASDARTAEETKTAVARAEAAVAAARPGGGRTFAVAVGRLARAKAAAWVVGGPVDADALVQLAEEAHAAAPSAGTEGTLQLALLMRAHLALAAADPGYAKLAEKTRRSLGPAAVYYALAGGPLRDKVAANPDVKRLAGLTLEALARDPEAVGPAAWVLVRAVQPDRAAAVAAAKADEWDAARRRLDAVLTPFRVTTDLDEYYALLMDGQEAEAAKVRAALAAKGVPAP